MQNRETGNGVSLRITLSPQDMEFLRTAAAAEPTNQSRPGPADVGKLAQSVLGSVCRAILAQGYRPKPLLAELGRPSQAQLPVNVVLVQFPVQFPGKEAA